MLRRDRTVGGDNGDDDFDDCDDHTAGERRAENKRFVFIM